MIGLKVVSPRNMTGRTPDSLSSGFQKSYGGTVVTGFSGVVPYAKRQVRFTIKPG